MSSCIDPLAYIISFYMELLLKKQLVVVYNGDFIIYAFPTLDFNHNSNIMCAIIYYHTPCRKNPQTYNVSDTLSNRSLLSKIHSIESQLDYT